LKHPFSLATLKINSQVSSFTSELPEKALETVKTETFASFAFL
jgi:hypothetical protein